MQRLEVSDVVRLIYRSLGVKGLSMVNAKLKLAAVRNQCDSLKACGGTGHGVHAVIVE